MKISGSGQRKTQRVPCSRAHGKQAVPIEFKLSRGKGELLTGLWHGDHTHKYLRAISAWRRGLLTGLRHGHPAYRHLRAIPACKEVSKRKKAVISEQREEMASVQREEMVSKQGEEEVLPGGDDGFGGKTAR